MKDLTKHSINYARHSWIEKKHLNPANIPVIQNQLDEFELEERETNDPEFERIVTHLDRYLDSLPINTQKDEALKHYLIYFCFNDPDDQIVIQQYEAQYPEFKNHKSHVLQLNIGG